MTTVQPQQGYPESFSTMTDEQIVELAREGDNVAQEYLINKYKNFVRAKARSYFLIGADKEDIIQEGMIGLFKAVRDYQPDKEASFQTFARMCVDRQIYNAIQNSNRQKHQPLNSYISLSQDPGESQDHLQDMWADNPESIIIDQENVRSLEQEITCTLSLMENQVLEYYLDGMGYAEIAALMKKTPKSIDNALQRIRTKIKEQLKSTNNIDNLKNLK